MDEKKHCPDCGEEMSEFEVELDFEKCSACLDACYIITEREDDDYMKELIFE